MAQEPLDQDFQELEKRLAARDLADMKKRWRIRIVVLAGVALVTLLVIVGVRALLHDSPCVEILDATSSKARSGLTLTDHSEASLCWATLSDAEGAPKIRVFAAASRVKGMAMSSLQMRPYLEIEPLQLGDDAILAIGAKPSKEARRSKPEEGTPTWLSQRDRFSTELPDFHVAIIEKGDSVLTVELDAGAFTPEEAEKLVMSMKPKLSEMRRLRPQ